MRGDIRYPDHFIELPHASLADRFASPRDSGEVRVIAGRAATCSNT
jgi:hypothetical protein